MTPEGDAEVKDRSGRMKGVPTAPLVFLHSSLIECLRTVSDLGRLAVLKVLSPASISAPTIHLGPNTPRLTQN